MAKKFLYAENDWYLQSSVSCLLSSYYSVTCANDIESIKEFLEKDSFDFIILGSIPDAPKVTKTIRESGNNLPILGFADGKPWPGLTFFMSLNLYDELTFIIKILLEETGKTMPVIGHPFPES